MKKSYLLMFYVFLFTSLVSCGAKKDLAVSDNENVEVTFEEVNDDLESTSELNYEENTFIWIASVYSEDNCGEQKCLLSRSCKSFSWKNQKAINGFEYELGFEYHLEIGANNELVKIWIKEKI